MSQVQILSSRLRSPEFQRFKDIEIPDFLFSDTIRHDDCRPIRLILLTRRYRKVKTGIVDIVLKGLCHRPYCFISRHAHCVCDLIKPFRPKFGIGVEGYGRAGMA